jgi:phosphohistidine phosphatase
MSLTLYLLRHAKSGWDNPSLEDFDRPLSDRGRREAQWLGEFLRTRGISPSRIVCSAAQRTRETLAGVVPSLAREASIEITRRLYEAPAERLLSVVREQLPTDDIVMLIGHNPGLEDFAGMLSGTGDRLTIAALRDKFPPAGLASFEFDATRWSDVSAANARLVAFDTPPRD